MIGVNSSIFLQLGLVVIIAAAVSYVLKLLKQPQIIAYVLAGILITPIFKLVTDTSIIESMSLIGIAFLLFLVGLEIDLKRLQNVALVSILGGGMVITLMFVFGYTAALLLGLVGLEAGYMGLMLVFSSTMVVMKLLSDKRELNTLHGRIVVGILLLEDLIAIFALTVLTSSESFSGMLFASALLKFVIIVLAAYLCSKFVFPFIFRFAAKNQELLLITSLAVCFIFSLIFHYLGFSLAIGAFLAGITLGNLEYNLEIVGRVKSLRDFFSLLFFVTLGMDLSLGLLGRIWLPLLIIIFLIVFLKPLIIMTVCSLFKYTKKPAFLTATSLAQIGEFSLIVAMQGLILGHISQDSFSLIVLVMLATIMITSYLIQYDQQIYKFLEPVLKIFDSFATEGLEYLPSNVKPKIILCGYNRIGYSILNGLSNVKKKVLIIDYNPEVITKLVKKGYHCIYGEVSDEEIIERMNLREVSLLISTVPDMQDNVLLLKKIRAVNKHAHVFATASTIDDALKLYELGADYVILPHFLGGEHASNMITNLRAKKIMLREEKARHINMLQERKEIGHEHPKD